MGWWISRCGRAKALVPASSVVAFELEASCSTNIHNKTHFLIAVL